MGGLALSRIAAMLDIASALCDTHTTLEVYYKAEKATPALAVQSRSLGACTLSAAATALTKTAFTLIHPLPN